MSKATKDTAETTLDQLVLPPGHKNIVKSLISQHFQDKTTGRYEAEEKDVVRGKGAFSLHLSHRINAQIRLTRLNTGKGLIILLHGAPGVGKTSTAGNLTPPPKSGLFISASYHTDHSQFQRAWQKLSISHFFRSRLVSVQ